MSRCVCLLQPPPAVKYLRIASVTNTTTISSSKVTCTFKLQVVDSTTLKAVTAGPSLAARWTLSKKATGWPYSTAYTGTTAGLVTATAKAVTQSGGGTCTLTVTSLSLAGYNGMDPANTLKVFTHKW